MHNTIGVVILAAGDGKRMKTGIPKVMNVLHGEPLVGHVVDHVIAAHVCDKPVVIVSATHTLVQDYLGDRAVYAIQEKQLGTGHAAACAESVLKGAVDHVMVLYGDMPLLSSGSIRRLAERHVERGNTVTLATATVSDFTGLNVSLQDFGRIIRGDNGHIKNIVELRDATPEQASIKEVNTGTYCFKADWFWNAIKQIKNTNAQQEYYLTDAVGLAIEMGEKISSISIEPKEAIGVNTKEQLDLAERA